MSLSKRDTFVRYLDPKKIFWLDAAGQVHASIKNALIAFELPDNPAEREAVKEILLNSIRMADPDAKPPEYREVPDSLEYFTQTQDPTKQ